MLVLAGALATAPAHAARPVAIFYYPWYGTISLDGAYQHWYHSGWPFRLASGYFPARGPYSSSDPTVVRAQMKEIAGTGVREVVSSWWGWGSVEDLRLPAVLAAARERGLTVAVHLEPYPNRTIGSVEADIAHLRELGISRVYVYRPFDIPETDWATMRTRVTGVQMLAQTTDPARAAAAQFEGIYTYDILLVRGSSFAGLCRRARALRLLCAPSVGPGYDARRLNGDKQVKARLNGRTYDTMWGAAIAAPADAVTITSYNEWGEGTQIEPARAYSEQAVSDASFASYEGAWGLHGRAAERAYLDRTRYWVARFNP